MAGYVVSHITSRGLLEFAPKPTSRPQALHNTITWSSTDNVTKTIEKATAAVDPANANPGTVLLLRW